MLSLLCCKDVGNSKSTKYLNGDRRGGRSSCFIRRTLVPPLQLENEREVTVTLANDMNQTTKALLKNANNPKLAWQIFKRVILNSPTNNPPLDSVPTIAHILIRSKMLQEIHTLHSLLLSLKPRGNSHSSLTSLVKILAKSGLFDEAFSQFKSIRMHFPGDPPCTHLYNILFECCVTKQHIDCLMWLYKDMVVAKVSPGTYTFNLLIRALCDSGHLEDARKLFDKISDKGCRPNEFSFAILVRGYCRAGLADEGLELMELMRNLGFSPNMVVYNTLISSFCRDGKTDDAEKMVDRLREDGLFPDVVTFNSRISALCRTGKILEASRIFRDMQMDEDLGLPRPNIITYNLMLEGFCKEGMLEEAKTLVEAIKKNGVFLNLESYNIWLMGLVRNGKLVEAQAVLQEMVEMGVEPSIYSYNILIDGLCKNRMLSDARMVMGLMVGRGISPDTITYSTLLHGYCSNGKIFDAKNVLHQMIRNGCSPTTFTCNILLHSLYKEGRISEAEDLLQKLNERGCGLDTVTCNIIINGLCNFGKLDKAIEIVNEMWTQGSAALGNLGNFFVVPADDTNSKKICLPDLITYSTVISALCKAGKLDEAKKKFTEMMEKNVRPDSLVYDNFIHSYCKEGKISSAFRVLKDMEKNGCSKTLRTYNSLMLGLGIKAQLFEIYGLLNEMRERGVSPNVCTYNNILKCLCEGSKIEDAISCLDEMQQKGILNISSFRMLVRVFCKAGEFRVAQEAFKTALSMCGHKEGIYSLMFNELLVAGEVLEAKEIFEAALEKSFDLGNFLYKDLIDGLCKDEKLEEATGILYKMIDKGYGFDPALFMPVIDAFGERGKKHVVDELAEKMMEMTSDSRVANKISQNTGELVSGKQNTYGGSVWQNILHRDDGSGIALKTLKRVQKGWGQGSISSLQPQKSDLLEYWEPGVEHGGNKKKSRH